MSSYRQVGTVLTDHVFALPVDHDRPDGEQIEVFAREVVAADRSPAGLPWLLFLQGGPGFGAQRPHGRDGWLDRALTDYRVLLLDQRGTGRSTPATRQTLARFGTAADQSDYLAHFRADAIVRDAELVRKALTGGEPWSVLGQSYGGFCTVTYLSLAPEGIREAFITGGLPGLDATADDVYRVTYGKVGAKTRAHYARYPGDVGQARRVARHLRNNEVVLPGGAPLTIEAFQSLGRMLDSSTGGDDLHYLIEDPFAGDVLSDAFLHAVQQQLSFGAAPAARGGRRAGRARELAHALQRGPAGCERRPGGGGRVLQRHVRAGRVLGAHRAGDPRAEGVGDQRVRSQRAARQQRRRA